MNPFVKREYSEKEKEIARKIGYFLYKKHNQDTSEAIIELRLYNITDIMYINNIIHILVGRPGMLIGKRGENIEQLGKYLDYEINIVEDKQTLQHELLCFSSMDRYAY